MLNIIKKLIIIIITFIINFNIYDIIYKDAIQ